MFVVFIIIIKLRLDVTYKDVPRLINVLKKEIKIFFPVGILMLGYQIYESGIWELSPKTYSYVLIFFYMAGILTILVFKFLENRSIENEYLILGLCTFIVFTPVFTIELLFSMIFGIT